MRSLIPHNFESRDAIVWEVVPAASVLQLGGQGQQHKLSEDVTWRCSKAVNLPWSLRPPGFSFHIV